MGSARKRTSGAAILAGLGSLAAACGPATTPRVRAASDATAYRLPETTSQLLVVTSRGWEERAAELRFFERRAGGWAEIGAAAPAVLGRSGLGVGRGLLPDAVAASLQGPSKREGDGRSPAGVFSLGVASGYEPELPEGAQRWPYRRAVPELRCVDDPASPLYNTLTLAPSAGPPPWASDEAMRRDDGLYRLTVFVDHNTSPATPGLGSCIFLHVWSGPTSPTSGCTAMEGGRIEALLRALDPHRHPLLVQLPAEVYTRVAPAWGFPALARR